MTQVTMREYPIRRRLPVSYSIQIGRIIVRWAYLEFQVQQTIYLLVGIGPKAGRLAIRAGGSIETRITLIEDLMRLRGVHMTTVNLKKFKAVLKEVELYRNRLAHGIWLKHTNTHLPVLQETRGRYSGIRGAAQAHDARINPRAVQVRIQNLRDIARSMENAQKTLSRLNKGLRGELLLNNSGGR